jgi:hypothetical protein
LRVVLPIGCLLGLLAFVLVDRLTGAEHSSGGCPSAQIPEVARVSPAGLGALRASVVGVLPGRVGLLYEEGPVIAGSAFSDATPLAPAISPAERRPAAYEMRWWSPGRDDIVADVFVFSSTARAARFMELALSTRCRGSASQAPTTRPVQGGNLAWLNPEGYRQADIYLARGSRVYRVSDVPAGAKASSLSPHRLRRAFYTIDTLACLIPGAGCGLTNRASPA